MLSTPSHVDLNAALDPGGERAEPTGKIVEFPERLLPLAGAGETGESPMVEQPILCG